MKLFCRKYGSSGHPLVILHGLFGMSDNWVSLAKVFSEKFVVYLPDLRNHGLSPHSDSMNYKEMADDIAQLFMELNIDKAYIIGHSMGGKVAMQFAFDYSDYVDKMIVVDIAPVKYPIHHREIVDALLNADLKTVTSRSQIDQLLAKQIDSVNVRQLLMKNIGITDNQYSWKLNIKAISNQLEYIFDAVEAKAQSNIPTLFVKGGNSDYIQPEKDINAIHSAFNNAEIATIKGASHWVQADEPTEFVNLVNQYLNT